MRRLFYTFFTVFIFANLNATNQVVTLKTDDKVNPVEGMFRYAIENSGMGDTISFEVDTIFLDSAIYIKGGVLTIDGGTGVILDGTSQNRIFNISCYSSSDSITIRNLTIQNGRIEKTSAMGGGMYASVFAGNLQVENCIFKNNSVVSSGDGQGGALRCSGGNFYNCFFLNNQVSGTTPVLGGGGIFAVGGTFNNCVIAGNSAKYGGGIYASGSTFIYCTVTQNSAATANSGGGISSESQTMATNCIFYNNIANGIDNNMDDIDGSFFFCALESGSSFAGSNNNIGLSASPFTHYGTDSLRLNDSAICIDAATETITGLLSNDIAGCNRIIGSGPDMGAYEYYTSYLMSDTIIHVQGGYFFDSGGEDASYSRDNYIMTFFPEKEETVLQFNFEDFNTASSSHYLKIYDGTSTHAPLLGSYYLNHNPGTITATNAEGAITFWFTTSTGRLEKGWKASIRSIVPGDIMVNPIAFFTFDTTSSVTPLSVQFNNYSTNFPDSSYWDFGDGSDSKEYSPVHDYAQRGVYFVSLITYNSVGMDTIIRSIKTADVDEFLMSDSVVKTDLGLFYDSGGEYAIHEMGEKYIMTFYPSSPDKVLQFNFEYFNTPDWTFTVEYYLKIYDGVSISSPLIGKYEGVCDIGTVTATNVEGALIFKFESYEHILGKDGWKAAIMEVDRIETVPPIAHFSFDTVSMDNPLEVKFVESSRNNPASWMWDFGDGSTSTERHPVHTYSHSDIYFVTLIASNTIGSDTLIQSIKTADVDDYLMADTTYTSDIGYFYDSGGKDYVYSEGENYTVTFYPATTGYALQFIFEEFKTGNWTHCLDIFDGVSTASQQIGSSYEYSESNSPGTVVASNPEGALTFRFKSDLSRYSRYGWKAAFRAFPYYAVNFIANENGTLSGNTSQEVLDSYSSEQVTANPEAGYHFVMWQNTLGDSICNENPLSITNVSQDSTLTAIFEVNNYKVSFEAGENGSLQGITEQNVIHGNDGSVIMALADVHYHFVEWQNLVGDSISNLNPITITNAMRDTSLIAIFEIDIYNASFAAGDNGSLEGIAEQHIPHGNSTTAVTAIAVDHSHFASWVNSTGSTISTENPIIITNVKSDTSLTAFFEKNRYNIQFKAELNGVIEGEESQHITYNENTSEISAIADTGYYFLEWQNRNGDLISRQNPLIMNNMKSDSTIFAIFEPINYLVFFNTRDNGYVEGETEQIINFGANSSEVLAVPNDGFYFQMWQNRQGDSITNKNPLIVGNVSGDTLLFAVFEQNITAVNGLSKNNIVIYPNPANERCTIQSEINNGSFKLVTLAGIIMTEGTINGNRQVIDISEFSDGVYIINIYTGTDNRQYFIVKNK